MVIICVIKSFNLIKVYIWMHLGAWLHKYSTKLLQISIQNHHLLWAKLLTNDFANFPIYTHHLNLLNSLLRRIVTAFKYAFAMCILIWVILHNHDRSNIPISIIHIYGMVIFQAFYRKRIIYFVVQLIGKFKFYVAKSMHFLVILPKMSCFNLIYGMLQTEIEIICILEKFSL